MLYCYEANLVNTPLTCYGKTPICRIFTDIAYGIISVLIKGETADFVLPGFSGFLLYFRDSHRTPGIPILLPGLPLYSLDFHCTIGDKAR